MVRSCSLTPCARTPRRFYNNPGDIMPLWIVFQLTADKVYRGSEVQEGLRTLLRSRHRWLARWAFGRQVPGDSVRERRLRGQGCPRSEPTPGSEPHPHHTACRILACFTAIRRGLCFQARNVLAQENRVVVHVTSFICLIGLCGCGAAWQVVRCVLDWVNGKQLSWRVGQRRSPRWYHRLQGLCGRYMRPAQRRAWPRDRGQPRMRCMAHSRRSVV